MLYGLYFSMTWTLDELAFLSITLICLIVAAAIIRCLERVARHAKGEGGKERDARPVNEKGLL